ncbi:MAG: D-aminoacyl-tRNA deacylase [Syntrophales bacterium]|nr:D-aminoacyl-tRNA deacylase [Syntrophales bacterium]MCK9527240.1 D-aminoacyl-tRNA deacylase [Syntrophales bacterium]MDX9921290.1 D-aminoacyl-tRNA deacylase [Syntrophales bacterium]
MRAVIQRIHRAKVTVDGACVGSAGRGILVFLGVGKGDGTAEAEFLCDKILNLRIFEDEAGKMNRSLLNISGDMLIISQFTLFADTSRGRRPSFTDACEPETAGKLYEHFVACARKHVTRVATGSFQKMMDVELVNYGPVTVLLDTETMKNTATRRR